jgi:outer membrane immunogenic protein
MKRILLSSVALGVLALATPAMSADLPMKAAPVVAPVYDWTGIWFGGFGGYAFGNHNLNNALGFQPVGFTNYTANWESHGPFGGGEVGYYWQTGQAVWGIAGDFAGTSIKGTDDGALGQVGNAPVIDSNKLKWLASFTAQGGITVDRLMLYFKGGWAAGDITHTNINPGVAVDTFTVHRSGLVAGGGIAYAMTDNIIGKIEYRYYDLGTYHRDTPLNGVLPYTVTATYSTAVLGLDVKFGGGSRVVAKY